LALPLPGVASGYGGERLELAAGENGPKGGSSEPVARSSRVGLARGLFVFRRFFKEFSSWCIVRKTSWSMENGEAFIGIFMDSDGRFDVVESMLILWYL